jgi:lysozyme
MIKIIEQIIRHEGLRLKPYHDSAGKLSIGVGRNLDDKGIREDEAIMMLMHDISDATSDAAALVDNFHLLDEVRQRVLVDMAFNLGRTRLGTFRRMIEAVRNNRFEEAAAEMVNSRWYRQVGERGMRLEYMMRSGEDDVD